MQGVLIEAVGAGGELPSRLYKALGEALNGVRSPSRQALILVLTPMANAIRSLGDARLARAFKAWSEEALVLVSAHGAQAPLGLRDLPLLAWDPDVEEDDDIARTLAELVVGRWMVNPRRRARKNARLERRAQKKTSSLLGAPPLAPLDRPERSAPGKAALRPPPTLREHWFLSYARSDADAAEAIGQACEAAGAQAWIDRANLSGADRWPAEIAAAISASRGVLLAASEAAYRSDHVLRELLTAQRAGKPILPIQITPQEPPQAIGELLLSHRPLALPDLNAALTQFRPPKRAT